VLLSVDGLREAPGRQDGPAGMARLARGLGYAGPVQPAALYDAGTTEPANRATAADVRHRQVSPVLAAKAASSPG